MPEPVFIGNRAVGPGNPVFVVAEAGVNHNGDLKLAKRLVSAASHAGADAVKFQTFKAGWLTAAKKQFEMLKRLELSEKAHRELQACCAEKGILFMSSAFDEEGADFLEGLGVPVFKIPSGEITNLPLLAHIARKGRPVILSTGMSYLDEVGEAARVIREAGNGQLVLLHCVSSYPAAPGDANLCAMRTMGSAFRVPVGYSDHTPGVEVAVAAVALGACVIEKHFTLDRSLPGPDQAASLEPGELAALVSGIRVVEASLGHGRKEPAKCEEGNRLAARKSLVANEDIPAGALIERRKLRALRPAGGISPGEISRVAGRKAARSLKMGEVLRWEDLR